MRTIKFRGYNEKRGVWLYGSHIINRGAHFVAPDEFANGKTWEDYEVIPETVGQYTGLTDKNGREIYEGDIVRHDENGKCYSIIYEEPMFRFAPNDDCFAFLNHPELLEVIGNIHDNPDLIEKGGEQ